MLQSINKQLEKIMPLITPASVVLGVLVSAYIKDYSFLIPWIFAFMTFSGSLGSNFGSLKDAFMHPLPIVITLLILHVVMPLWAWSIGHIVFSEDIFTITGLILGMAIPTGITSMIWVSIYKGNIPITLSLILVDTLLSPILVPFTISLIVGQKIEMDVSSIMTGLLGMIVIPSLLGMLINHLTKGKVKEVWSPRLAPFSKIGIGAVVMLNGAVVAPHLRNISLELVIIAIAVFFIAITGYFFSFIIGKIIFKNKETVVALTFTGGMRNISAGAVIATSYFPAAVAVPVVVGMLFQQVLASLSGYLIDRHYHRHESKTQLTA
ncbi:bile acid:sodium symporter family protein [Neobacillus sp. D3-1R]|uniref:bile acid:sodium symporter family protein n=1 Tax=Neobacillus sp. D3-1R TaxID=3445778 RepID=UPI003FA1948D